MHAPKSCLCKSYWKRSSAHTPPCHFVHHPFACLVGWLAYTSRFAVALTISVTDGHYAALAVHPCTRYGVVLCQRARDGTDVRALPRSVVSTVQLVWIDPAHALVDVTFSVFGELFTLAANATWCPSLPSEAPFVAPRRRWKRLLADAVSALIWFLRAYMGSMMRQPCRALRYGMVLALAEMIDVDRGSAVRTSA